MKKEKKDSLRTLKVYEMSPSFNYSWSSRQFFFPIILSKYCNRTVFPKMWSWTSGIHFTQELVRNANSPALPTSTASKTLAMGPRNAGCTKPTL